MLLTPIGLALGIAAFGAGTETTTHENLTSLLPPSPQAVVNGGVKLQAHWLVETVEDDAGNHR